MVTCSNRATPSFSSIPISRGKVLLRTALETGAGSRYGPHQPVDARAPEDRRRARDAWAYRSSLRRSSDCPRDWRESDRVCHERADSPSPPAFRANKPVSARAGATISSEGRRHPGPARSARPRLWASRRSTARPTHLPPRKIDHWVLGDPLAFLIEIGGKRIFINSGGRGDQPLALSDRAGRSRYRGRRQSRRDRRLSLHDRAIEASLYPAQPSGRFLPAAQQRLCFPAADRFSRCSPRRRRRPPRAQLILLDYFKPWTLR